MCTYLIDDVPISSKIFPCTVSNKFPMPITLLLMMPKLLTEINNTFSLYFIWYTELSLFVLQIIGRGFTSSLCIFMMKQHSLSSLQLISCPLVKHPFLLWVTLLVYNFCCPLDGEFCLNDIISSLFSLGVLPILRLDAS